jgi:peroxygenase
MAHLGPDRNHCIALHGQPVTEQHKPFVATDGEPLNNSGTARATLAASRDAPNGTVKDGWAESHQHQTVRSISLVVPMFNSEY